MADTLPPQGDALKPDTKYVYFHAGAEAAYRKVADTPSGFVEIPTIDLAHLDGSLADRTAIAADVARACRDCGFFYVKNHGIPQDVIDQTFAVLERFFALDEAVKMDAHVQKNPAIRGYEPMLETRLDPRTRGDIKEAFTMGDCVVEPEQDYVGRTGHPPPAHITQPQNIWPKDAPWWREGLYSYYPHVLSLSLKLVKIFALALLHDEHALDAYFTFPITGMRALFYPPTPVDDTNDASAAAANVGLGAHSDFSWLTLVLQQDGVPALEVINPDGLWVDAPPVPGTLVCNVGQYLERQTNGLFPATVHRVRNRTGQPRYSLPFFLTMDPDATVAVLDACRKEGDDQPDKYDAINVGDLYIRRVLPARSKHPTSIAYRDVPQDQWTYRMLLR